MDRILPRRKAYHQAVTLLREGSRLPQEGGQPGAAVMSSSREDTILGRLDGGDAHPGSQPEWEKQRQCQCRDNISDHLHGKVVYSESSPDTLYTKVVQIADPTLPTADPAFIPNAGAGEYRIEQDRVR